jgi:putative nucleotidyltransferase with HDIG domain
MASAMNLMTPPDALSRLRHWERLPPFHPVALRLMRVIASDYVPLNEISNIIRSDTVFAAELLRLANSPLFTFRCEIASVLQAVSLLGLERVRGLALTVALRRFLDESAPGGAARVCWRHSLACALLSEEIALAALLPTDVAHTAGLVHDLGRLVLLASDPERYTALLDGSEPSPAAVCERERRAFGLDHCEAGAAVMERWSFPASLGEVAATHHHPASPELSGMPDVVRLACRTADALGFHVTGTPAAAGDEALAALLPVRIRARFRDSGAEMAAALATKINSMEICV